MSYNLLTRSCAKAIGGTGATGNQIVTYQEGIDTYNLYVSSTSFNKFSGNRYLPSANYIVRDKIGTYANVRVSAIDNFDSNSDLSTKDNLYVSGYSFHSKENTISDVVTYTKPVKKFVSGWCSGSIVLDYLFNPSFTLYAPVGGATSSPDNDTKFYSGKPLQRINYSGRPSITVTSGKAYISSNQYSSGTFSGSLISRSTDSGSQFLSGDGYVYSHYFGYVGEWGALGLYNSKTIASFIVNFYARYGNRDFIISNKIELKVRGT